MINIISIFIGFVYLLGYIWYSSHYLTEPIHFILFNLSTSLALIVVPLIPRKLLKYILIRVLTMLLIILGTINNIYLMYVDLTMINGADWPAFFIRLFVLCILFYFLWRSIKGQSEPPTV